MSPPPGRPKEDSLPASLVRHQKPSLGASAGATIRFGVDPRATNTRGAPRALRIAYIAFGGKARSAKGAPICLPKSRQGGFVLVLTLWMLAIMTLGATFFAARIESAVELARQSQLNVRGLIDLADTRAEILFRLGVTPMSVYGLGRLPAEAIALDNRPYLGAAASRVRLQDNRGLLNINGVSDESLHRLFTVLGVAPERRAGLIDKLRDYIDADDLRRLNGAEAPDYVAAGLPPPPNDLLITPFETRGILGWRDVAELWQGDGLPGFTTTYPSAGLNPNTAPWQVLATLAGATDDSVKATIARRKLEPFQSPDEAAAALGVPLGQPGMPNMLLLLPARSVRVAQYLPGAAWAINYNVTLTPMSDEAPWRIDYYFRSRSTYHDDPADSIPTLPKRDREVATPATPVLSTP